jgi:2-dehydro-3-deoxyphosphogalactonate aldolase
VLRNYLTELPLVAILRGLKPENAEAVGHALVEAGFRIIEVPLNSPEPFRSSEIWPRHAEIRSGRAARALDAIR